MKRCVSQSPSLGATGWRGRGGGPAVRAEAGIPAHTGSTTTLNETHKQSRPRPPRGVEEFDRSSTPSDGDADLEYRFDGMPNVEKITYDGEKVIRAVVRE